MQSGGITLNNTSNEQTELLRLQRQAMEQKMKDDKERKIKEEEDKKNNVIPTTQNQMVPFTNTGGSNSMRKDNYDVNNIYNNIHYMFSNEKLPQPGEVVMVKHGTEAKNYNNVEVLDYDGTPENLFGDGIDSTKINKNVSDSDSESESESDDVDTVFTKSKNIIDTYGATDTQEKEKEKESEKNIYSPLITSTKKEGTFIQRLFQPSRGSQKLDDENTPTPLRNPYFEKDISETKPVEQKEEKKADDIIKNLKVDTTKDKNNITPVKEIQQEIPQENIKINLNYGRVNSVIKAKKYISYHTGVALDTAKEDYKSYGLEDLKEVLKNIKNTKLAQIKILNVPYSKEREEKLETLTVKQLQDIIDKK